MNPNHLHAEQASRFNLANAAAATTAAEVQRSNGRAGCYELRFVSLFDEGRGYAFPCDAAGHVNLDALGDRARNNYFYARAVVGREFSMPAVQLGPVH